MADPYGEGQLVDFHPRCWRCQKLLTEYATRPWRAKCVRCKAVNQAGDVPPGAPPANAVGPAPIESASRQRS